MTRHAEPNIKLLARKLPFYSDVRQWSHPLMIPLHCLWTKSNNRTRGQYECDVWLGFVFDFVRSYARCGCCSVVCLRFQVVQIKQVDCKMSTKNVNNYKWKAFCEYKTKIIRPQKKQMSKEVKEKPVKIIELILKRKADLKEGLDNI